MMSLNLPHLQSVLGEVFNERLRQFEKWGEQNHPDVYPDLKDCGGGYICSSMGLPKAEKVREAYAKAEAEGGMNWLLILLEELCEAAEETGDSHRDPTHLRKELVQVAAVAVAWVESLDRRKATEENPVDS